MSKMDFSGFKKISQDEHTATFQHERDGHQLTIAHKSLSPKLREQLDALPIYKMAEGGSVQGVSEATDAIPDQPTSDAPLAPKPPQESYYPDTSSSGVSAVSGAEPSSPPPVESSAPSAPGVELAGPANPPAPIEADPMMAEMSGATNAQIAGLQEQKAGQQAIAKAQGDLGAAQAQQEKVHVEQLQSQQSAYEAANQTLTAERTALQNDIAQGHINPNHYVDSMSTGKSVRTGIGLILGGMGAGLTHGPNLAFQYLQSQIDRDIQAQQTELGKKQNLLSHNLQAAGNLRAGMELTRLHSNDLIASQLRMEAAKSQNPIAQGNLLNIAGMFDQKSAELQHNLAMQKMMMGGSQGGSSESQFQRQMSMLRMNGREQLAKDMEAKHVPGVGQASKEVPGDVMKELISRQDLHDKISDLQHFAAQNSGSINPTTIKQGAAKAALVQDAYRRANAQGVFKESESKFVSSIVSPNPTQFFEKYRAGQGYKEMGRDNLSTLNNLKQGYGLPAGGGHSGSPRQQGVAQNFGFVPKKSFAGR